MNGSINALATAACLLLLPVAAWSEEVIQSVRWQDLATARALTSGTVVTAVQGAGGPSLRIVHDGPGPATFPLVNIERPRISAASYALRGQIRYERVADGSYLEMWNYLPEGAFFSRSLAPNGPMGRLEGSSGWRPFVVPFFNREGGAPPEKLVFNLVLTGAGTVEIGPVDLIQFAANEDLLGSSGAWWSDRQAGMLGGIVGSVLGILGAFIGWLGSTARARGFVLGTVRGLAWFGVGSLVLGVFALSVGQPYAVYYPLLLLGVTGAALGFSLPRTLTKRYEEVELRRMQALDA